LESDSDHSLKPEGESDARDYTFVALHLAANEGYVQQRNKDMNAVLTNLNFGDGYGAYRPGTHVFVMGDMNYRAIRSPISSTSDNDAPENDEVVELLEVSDYRQVDELYLAREAGNVLEDLEEPDVTFAPTYKFIIGEMRPSASAYNSKRIPSWCDRIFHGKYDPDSGFSVHAYDAVFGFGNSDHRPVYQSLSIPHTSMPHVNTMVLNPAWSLGASATSLSDMVLGRALYLALTRNGNYYLAGAIALLFIYFAFF
jgi:hypothetical protein